MRERPRPRSPLQLVVLSLVDEAPMHPYRMHALIKGRGKDQVANVSQRNSVYQTIRALSHAKLIGILETQRAERRPERTVYEITPKGKKTLARWMETLLSTPTREFLEFPAALAHVAGLKPAVVAPLLEARVVALQHRIAGLEVSSPDLPRVFSLESEYATVMTTAELEWLRSVIRDLRARRINWSAAMLRKVAARFPIPASM
jgi:DNA-binding PadR family transcriptional regulator